MKVISKNKKAFFNFEILDKYEAGIELHGWEVKSIRANHVHLKGAFCTFQGEELFMSNMYVSTYMNVSGDETRPRKLLLHKKQLARIKEKVSAKGMAVVPIALKWSSKGYVKVDIAIAKGKNLVDKRQTIKKRDMEREQRKTLKGM